MRVLFFRYTLTPRKKKAVKIKKFTYKKHQKRLAKQRAKEEADRLKKIQKEKEKQEKKRQKEKEPKERTFSIPALIRMGIYLLKKIPPRLFRCFSVNIRRLHISVATGDAAKTAIRYGYFAQGTAYLLALLDKATKLNRAAYKHTSVYADFLGFGTKMNADLIISIRPIRLIPFAVYSLFHFITIRNQLLPEKAATEAEKEKETQEKASVLQQHHTENQ